jgi:hypothetical protein
MTQAALYRSYAEKCFEIARAATDEAERGRWLGMAQSWLQWAQEIEAGLANSETRPDD